MRTRKFPPRDAQKLCSSLAWSNSFCVSFHPREEKGWKALGKITFQACEILRRVSYSNFISLHSIFDSDNAIIHREPTSRKRNPVCLWTDSNAADNHETDFLSGRSTYLLRPS